jgi:hypothetical protein
MKRHTTISALWMSVVAATACATGAACGGTDHLSTVAGLAPTPSRQVTPTATSVPEPAPDNASPLDPIVTTGPQTDASVASSAGASATATVVPEPTTGAVTPTPAAATTVDTASPAQPAETVPTDTVVTFPGGTSDVAKETSAPRDPSNVRLVLSGSVVSLEWAGSFGTVTGYRIRRNNSTIAELAVGARSFVDRPPAGSTVAYQIVAFGPAGESPGNASNVVTIPSASAPQIRVEQSSTNSGGGASSQQNSVVIVSGGKA